jgi:hypothetical protein
MISAGRTNPRHIVRLGFVFLIIGVALFAANWRLSTISAEGPVVEINAPEQVVVGEPITLAVVVRNASGIGGYQGKLLFDTSRARMSGVDHSANELAAIGRYIQALGPNEFDGGISFGLYSCPVDACGSTGKPVDRGADGDLHLVTVSITPEQPGPLSLEFTGLRFADASGAEVDVEMPSLTVVVNAVVGQE